MDFHRIITVENCSIGSRGGGGKRQIVGDWISQNILISE